MDKYTEKRISWLLREIGVSPGVRGYGYLKTAIDMTYHNPSVVRNMMKGLYTGVAETHDTTPTGVERAIRHAIGTAWDRGDLEILEGYFGHSVSMKSGKPTNREFITVMAEQLALHDAQMASQRIL